MTVSISGSEGVRVTLYFVLSPLFYEKLFLRLSCPHKFSGCQIFKVILKLFSSGIKMASNTKKWDKNPYKTCWVPVLMSYPLLNGGDCFCSWADTIIQLTPKAG